MEKLVEGVCKISDGKVAEVINKSILQDEVIWTLQYNASVNENPEVKQAAIKWINAIADALDLECGSNFAFYQEKSQSQRMFFTVPAINSRMITFHTTRAAARAAEILKVPHIIFELALSEGGYTGQKMDEYAALVKAAYISLGLQDRMVYLQADHYQIDPGKYAADPKVEMERAQKAIEFALQNGVYNIDIDTSKFEIVDPNKSDEENQAENARLTAELLFFIREYEKKYPLPDLVSVGGEVGEVGGINTKYPQVNAYLNLIHKQMVKLGASNAPGLSKVSINVGSAHGGVLGQDGKPMESVPLDFQAHHDLFTFAEDPSKPGDRVLSVQHGASTLPRHYFPLFPAMHVAEIHLATGFQNIVWDVLEKEDGELYQRMKGLTSTKFGEHIAKHKTQGIGFMKERKRVTEFVKKELLLSPAIPAIEKELGKEFTTIFSSLYSILLPKSGGMVKGNRAD